MENVTNNIYFKETNWRKLLKVFAFGIVVGIGIGIRLMIMFM